MENVYGVMIDKLDDWGKCEDEESKNDYLNITRKFNLEVKDSISSMAPGQDLFTLDEADREKFSGPSANETEKNKYFE